MTEPLFRIWDRKYEKWAGVRDVLTNKGRSLDEYGKEFGLMSMDMEGFCITDDGEIILRDECGGEAWCDPKRFQLCFPTERVEGMEKSPSGTYYLVP